MPVYFRRLKKSDAYEKNNQAKNTQEPQNSVMLELAKVTHGSWYTGEKKQGYFVEYTQEVHDALVALCEQGKLLTPGKDTPISIDLLLNPKKKWKFSKNEILADVDDVLVKNLEQAMGRNIDSGFKINTVASKWETALSLEVSEDWAAKRPAYLYGLQADSVAAVYSCLTETDVIEPLIANLESGDEAAIMDSLVDVLRAINVGWRINNAWGGWNDPLINRPFGTKDIGGIGLEDILRDALVLKPILETLEAFRASGNLNTYPLVSQRI